MSSNPRRSRTKIVATVGPACRDREKLKSLVIAGADIFRINTAHGSRDDHDYFVRTVRSLEEELHRPLAVLIDLAGPKIRLGRLLVDPLQCNADETFTFLRSGLAPRDHELTASYEQLVDELEPGNTVVLADGMVSMQVERITERGAECRVTQSGEIRSRQGINLPGARLSIPAMTPADRDNANWAAEAGVDFVGLSFVRTAQDVQELAALLRCKNSRAGVIAKIEKPEALDNLRSIVEAADAIMVARGDLGVEIDVARIAAVQKQIIDECSRNQTPIITATQMLESMHHSMRPTRAEATDVANAILDGTDACMLSGETAIGDYPRETVEMMRRIALATEPMFQSRPPLPPAREILAGLRPVTQAAVYGADVMARSIDARLFVVASHSGMTALALSKRRLFHPVLGVSADPHTLRQMCLYWGVTPVVDAPTSSSEALLQFVANWGREQELLSRGDWFVEIVGGMSALGHNTVVIHQA